MRFRRVNASAPVRMLVAALAVLGAAQTASAAECTPTAGLTGCVDSDNLWFNAGATRFFSMAPGTLAPPGRLSFGLGLSYLSRPIGLVVGSADPDGSRVWVVDNALNATFLFALGATERLQLTAAAPATLYQDGSGLYSVLGSDAALPRAGVRDLRFGLDYGFLTHSRTGTGSGLALIGRFQFALPTGEKDAMAGSRTITWLPSLAAEYRASRLTVEAEVGARIRGASSLAGTVVGSQVSAAVGANVEILPRYLSAGVEAFALFGVDEQSQTARADGSTTPPMPAEWMASVSSAPILGGDISAMLGAGGPLPFSDPLPLTTPRFRVSLALRYAPTGSDGDADGVLDRDDKCPAEKEDRDGFQDDDGCPEADNDGDRIPDDRDRCRDDAETVDGFKDDDGCPDLDDDSDTIPDAEDQCRNEAEDLDSFEDQDGCPDLDNDRDGIPDKSDLCVNGAEDKDGFRDNDGCPEPDNDLDNVLDADDLCPSAAEDRDGFKDTDGCPEPDNDEDGILDGADACINAAETIDGVADGDGCPEPNAKNLVKWDGNLVLVDPPITFAKGSAEAKGDFAKRLAMVAQLVRGATPTLVIVETYADRVGDTSAKGAELADKRALAIKAELVKGGISADIITAVAGDPKAKRPNVAWDVTVKRPKPKAPKSAPPAVQEKPK
ncbi:MAG: OmpA family protein [Polyangiaceae bacterium]|nr:OmpA family protein [Polyangiaceae bacterium]